MNNNMAEYKNTLENVANLSKEYKNKINRNSGIDTSVSKSSIFGSTSVFNTINESNDDFKNYSFEIDAPANVVPTEVEEREGGKLAVTATPEQVKAYRDRLLLGQQRANLPSNVVPTEVEEREGGKLAVTATPEQVKAYRDRLLLGQQRANLPANVVPTEVEEREGGKLAVTATPEQVKA